MSWLLQQWNELLQKSGVDPGTTPRQMRVQRLEVTTGIISAQVATRTAGVCTLRIAWPPLNDSEWNRILDLLSGQALFSAQLLAGEFPAEIQKLFDEADLPLLPDDLSEWRIIESHCEETDPDDSEQQIEEAAAVIYRALGELFDEDPWLILHMRGRSKHQLLQALRDRRHEPGNGATVPEWSPGTPSASPLEPVEPSAPAAPDVLPLFAEEYGPSAVDEFWGANKRPRHVHYRIEPPSIDRALLRRLGPPPFTQDSSAIYETLSDIYTRVSEAALALAYATDVADTETEDGDAEEATPPLR